MDAEGTTLANELFEQNRGVLGELVVLCEEDLELVHDEHSARHGLVRRFAIGSEILHARLAEQVAAMGHLRVQPAQDAQAELAVALDGDRPCVRQTVCCVGLEFDALLEVDQV